MLDISKLIDHSLLRQDAAEQDVRRLCNEAVEYGFHSVCIHPCFVRTAREILFSTHIKVAAVIGFPLGMNQSRVKIYEALEAVLNGADELDVVMNIAYAKAANWEAVEHEVADIITATPAAVHKIIIETCLLSDHEKKKACRSIMNAGAAYIKTSTGFSASGALIEDVKLIAAVTEGRTGIKAAGGIQTLADAQAFIHAGATRIGTSSGVKIMKEMSD